MCRGTSTRSPPVFIKLLAQLSSHRLTQGLVKMGLRIYSTRNAQYVILQRVEEELFSGWHRAAIATTPRHDAEKLPTLRSGIKSKEEVHG